MTKSEFMTRWRKDKLAKEKAAELDYIAYKLAVFEKQRRRKRA